MKRLCSKDRWRAKPVNALPRWTQRSQGGIYEEVQPNSRDSLSSVDGVVRVAREQCSLCFFFVFCVFFCNALFGLEGLKIRLGLQDRERKVTTGNAIWSRLQGKMKAVRCQVSHLRGALESISPAL